MLEQQQAQLVTGLQDLYQRVQTGEGWLGRPLTESEGLGHPLTHDILEQLGALKTEPQIEGPVDRFEDDLEMLQARLVEGEAHTLSMRHHSRGSVESDSDSSSSLDMCTPPQGKGYGLPFDFNQVVPITPSNLSPHSFDTNINISVNAWNQFPAPALSIHPLDVETEMDPTTLLHPQQQHQPQQQEQSQQSWALATIIPQPHSYISIEHKYNGMGIHHHSMPAPGLGPCLVPDWNEDAEFRAFMGQIAG